MKSDFHNANKSGRETDITNTRQERRNTTIRKDSKYEGTKAERKKERKTERNTDRQT